MEVITLNNCQIVKMRFLLLIFLTNFSFFSFSQTSNVDVMVTWPNWSSENRVEIYNPGGTLISTIDNGYTKSCINTLGSGTYIIKIETELSMINKKVLVK